MLIKILKKFASFFSDKLKIKVQPKTPSDLYIESISENCYQMFKKDFEKSFVFSDDDSIRSFAINEAIKKFDKKKLFLEFGVYKGDSINLFGKYLKKINIKDKAMTVQLYTTQFTECEINYNETPKGFMLKWENY